MQIIVLISSGFGPEKDKFLCLDIQRVDNPTETNSNAENFAEICTVADYVFVVAAAAEGLLDFILRFVWFRKFFGF